MSRNRCRKLIRLHVRDGSSTVTAARSDRPLGASDQPPDYGRGCGGSAHDRDVPRRASRTAAWAVLFNHLVGALLEMERNVEAERLGCLEVDDQIELDRSLDGKITRLRALEDTIGIGRRPLKIIELVIPV